MAIKDLRTTHTFAVLEVSKTAYAEIRDLLEAAGYWHAFTYEGGEQLIDMDGIALRATAKENDPLPLPYCPNCSTKMFRVTNGNVTCPRCHFDDVPIDPEFRCTECKKPWSGHWGFNCDNPYSDRKFRPLLAGNYPPNRGGKS